MFCIFTCCTGPNEHDTSLVLSKSHTILPGAMIASVRLDRFDGSMAQIWSTRGHGSRIERGEWARGGRVILVESSRNAECSGRDVRVRLVGKRGSEW